MSPILLLEVAYFIVELLQIVLETLDLIVSRGRGVLDTENVFFTLHHQVFLMLDSILSRLNFRLQTSDLVLGRLI